MTTVFTSRRIAHWIADGKVTIHVAPAPRTYRGPLPWLPGHSYPVRSGRGAATSRVVVTRVRHQALDELTPRELYDSGHRTRLELARWWLRNEIARQTRRGAPWDEDEILRRFAPHAARDAWRIDFGPDLEHQPRLLHADPSQGYTTLPQNAAAGEPEALGVRDLERIVDPARCRARDTPGRGYLEQRERDGKLTLEERLARLRARGRRGVDVRPEVRIIERQIAKAEQKIEQART